MYAKNVYKGDRKMKNKAIKKISDNWHNLSEITKKNVLDLIMEQKTNQSCHLDIAGDFDKKRRIKKNTVSAT